MADDSSDGGSSDRIAGLLGLYNEQNVEARWQEEAREKSAAAIIAANSIIVGIIAAFNLQFPFIIFCGVQYLLAHTGQKFILKYHALSERRHANSGALRRMITQALSPLEIERALDQCRTDQPKRLEKDSKVARQIVKLDKDTSIHELWYDLHGSFKVMSILLAVIIIGLDLQKGRPDSVIFQIWDGATALLASFGVG